MSLEDFIDDKRNGTLNLGQTDLNIGVPIVLLFTFRDLCYGPRVIPWSLRTIKLENNVLLLCLFMYLVFKYRVT